MIPVRLLLALALALGLSSLAAAPVGAAPAPVQAIRSSPATLTAPDGRVVTTLIWQATDEKAVVVFSHGFNAIPAAYGDLFADWAANGFTVIAPIHVDSVGHPDRARYDTGQAFMTRIDDLALVRDFARTTRPGKPLVAAGHSFGSLMSMIQGGAVTVVGPRGDADIRAVLAFSSPGEVPGLVSAETWAGLNAPLLMITGDNDLVPGFVADWRAHRAPFDRSPAGGKLLMVFAGADHGLVRNADPADMAFIRRTALDFLRAHALNDAEARARLDALTAPEGVTLERR